MSSEWVLRSLQWLVCIREERLCEQKYTFFENENEWQKTKPVPISFPRASRNFPKAKQETKKKSLIIGQCIGDNPIYLKCNPDGQDWDFKFCFLGGNVDFL